MFKKINKAISDLWNNKSARYNFAVFILNALFSIFSIFVLDNKILSIVYLLISLLIIFFDKFIFKDNYKERFHKVIEKIFDMNFIWKCVIFLFLIGVAVSPTILRIITKEVILIGSERPLSVIFNGNLITNIFGVSIVCSLFSNISKYNSSEIADTLLDSKSDIFELYFQFAFSTSILNAFNYEKDYLVSWSSFCNSMHLLIVVFLGMILFCILAVRVIHSKNYSVPIKYPTWTIFFVISFLFFCGSFSFAVYGANSERQEWILLLFNTLSFALTVVFFGIYTKKSNERKDNREEYFPYFQVVLFIALAIVNFVATLTCVDFVKWSTDESIWTELISGSIILVVTIFLLSFIGYMQDNNIIDKTEEELNEKSTDNRNNRTRRFLFNGVSTAKRLRSSRHSSSQLGRPQGENRTSRGKSSSSYSLRGHDRLHQSGENRHRSKTR